MKPTSNILTRVKVVKVRKDAPYQDQVEAVRYMINKDREGTQWKPLTYIAVKMKLDRAGYKKADQVYRLIQSCRDAMNPVKTLWWKMKV